MGLATFPVQRFKSKNAEIVGILAIVGALALLGLMVVQVVNQGAADTVERAAWWLPFGLAEVFFLMVLAAAWRSGRRRA